MMRELVSAIILLEFGAVTWWVGETESLGA